VTETKARPPPTFPSRFLPVWKRPGLCGQCHARVRLQTSRTPVVVWLFAGAAPVVWMTMADAKRHLRTAEMVGPVHRRLHLH